MELTPGKLSRGVCDVDLSHSCDDAVPAQTIESSFVKCFDPGNGWFGMASVAGAHYAFDIAQQQGERWVQNVEARRAMPDSTEFHWFEMSERLTNLKRDFDGKIRDVKGVSWTAGIASSGRCLAIQPLRTEPGAKPLSRLFDEIAATLETELDTIVSVLKAPEKRDTVCDLYRNFVPNAGDAQRLVDAHLQALEDNAPTFRASLERSEALISIVEFAGNGTTGGLSHGTLEDVDLIGRFDIPAIAIDRSRVAAVQAHDAHTLAHHVARTHLADIVFHEFGHIVANWDDDLQCVDGQVIANLYPPVNALLEVADLSEYSEALKRGKPDSVVKLASFNHLIRSLLLTIACGRERQAIPELIDGSALVVSYEKVAGALSGPLQRDDNYGRLLNVIRTAVLADAGSSR